VDKHVKRGTMLSENLDSWSGSDAMRVKLESRPNHTTIESACDSIGLLKNIRTVMFQFQSQRYSVLALHEAKRRFYLLTQDKHSTCQHYYETFKNNVEVIEYCGGVICKDTGLVDGKLVRTGLTRAAATPEQLLDAEDAARERVLACAFLFGSDKNRYGKLLEDLENAYT
jgi:predicted RNA-binding protein associated with RNAse of E/G family